MAYEILVAGFSGLNGQPLMICRLALLWYHTIVRPFFALDGANVQAGIEVASQLIKDSQSEFSESALFLFFTGRIHRLKVLYSDIRPMFTGTFFLGFT